MTIDEKCPACSGPIVGAPTHCPHCGIAIFQGAPARFDTEVVAADSGEKGDEHPDLVIVHRGEMSEIVALQATLGAMGYETYFLDNMPKFTMGLGTKIIDPFTTAGHVMITELQAPMDTASDVVRAIKEIKDKLAGTKQDNKESLTPRVTSDLAITTDLYRISRLAMCALLLVVPAPLGVYYCVKYLRLAAKMDDRPLAYGQIWFNLFACLWVSAVMLYFLLANMLGIDWLKF